METVSLSSREATEVVEGVYMAPLAAGERTAVWHFHVEPGARVPEHRYDAEVAGFVYRGAATFSVANEEHVVAPGESYAIPGGEPHTLANRGEDAAAGVTVFSPPLSGVPCFE